jgi:hypothetical protein
MKHFTLESNMRANIGGAFYPTGYSMVMFPNAVVAAHDDLDRGVEQARGGGHAAHAQGVGRGDHQQPGARDVGLDQHAGSAASPDTAGTPCAQLLDDLAVLFRHHERQAGLAQASAISRPTRAVAHQHHLPRQVAFLGGIGSSASGSSRAPAARQVRARQAASAAAARRPEHERIERDGDQAPATTRLCASEAAAQRGPA